MKIGIYGAGAVGCYLGGRLAAVGYDVTFLCRSRVFETLKNNGLRLSDFKGRNDHISADQLKLTKNPEDLSHLDMIFICVKSAATEQVAHELQQVLGKQQPILISFQNSVSNVPLLKRILTGYTILEGMVPFNVAVQTDGHFHQGTDGALYVKTYQDQTELKKAFQKAQLDICFSDDMQAVQWAKVLLNLNNPINALSGLPLKQQLSIRAYRQCLAMAQKEALHLLTLAQIKPAQLTAVSASFIPYVLGLPNFLFKLLSRQMLKIDPLARSSMQDDLLSGKATEVDWINGEVIELARQLGQEAPVNSHLHMLIKQAEQSKKNIPITADQLKAMLKQS